MTASVDIRDDIRRAEALLEVNRPADALAILTIAASSAPADVTVACLMARCHSATGDYARMLSSATDATRYGPGNEWGHRLRATALRKLGRDGEAVIAATTAVTLDPHHWYTHAGLAEALIAMPDRDDRKHAYESAKIALRMAPEISNTHVTMGRVLHSIGERRGARACFMRAIARNPTDPAGHTNLAAVDLDRGRILTAGRGLRGVAASNPGVPIHHDNVRVAAGRWITRFLDIVTLAAFVQIALSWFAPAPLGGRIALAVMAVVAAGSAIQFARMPVAMRTLALHAARGIDGMVAVSQILFVVFAMWSAITAALAHGGSTASPTSAALISIVMVIRFRGRLRRYRSSIAVRRRYRRYVLGARSAR